jgi:hypothetical protein
VILLEVAVLVGLAALYLKERRIMATLADLDAAVNDLVAEASSAAQLLDQIHTELLAALANASDPAAIQSVIDKVSAAEAALAEAADRDQPPT